MLLALRIALFERPWGALSAGFLIGTSLLGLLAAWTFLSQAWSDAPARAITEYDRVLLYLLGFVVLGAFGRTTERLRWLVRGIAAAAFVVCLCGLITRLAPDVWAIDPTLEPGRLSYPLGYWNAAGLLAAIGSLMALALTSDDREAPAARILAAAALPVLAATLLLTFSRGAIAAALAGLIALIVVARPRAILSGLLVAVPAVSVVVTWAYGAKLLASDDPTTAAAITQGHDLAFVVAVCTVLAAVARAALLPLDRRMQRFALPTWLRRPAVRWGIGGLVVAAAIAGAVAAGAVTSVSGQVDRFVHGGSLERGEQDLRGRLGDAGNNGRIQQWRVASNAFEREPLRGEGAGTYALEWDRYRPATYDIEDAHSLYAEIAGELGIVGLALVVAAILLVLVGFAARARGPDRVVGGALFAAGLAWSLRAAIDWDWEMPAVTLWFFAAGGLAWAAPADGPARLRPPSAGRLVAALACVLLALLPAQVFLTEAPLRQSARAFAAGDCETAVDRALDSSAVLDMRPQPFIVLGYCDVRLGRADLAVRAMSHAVRNDPGSWEGYYGYAVARAAAGLDPRPALRTAQRLNPRELLVGELRRRLGNDPGKWKNLALGARLPAG